MAASLFLILGPLKWEFHIEGQIKGAGPEEITSIIFFILTIKTKFSQPADYFPLSVSKK